MKKDDEEESPVENKGDEVSKTVEDDSSPALPESNDSDDASMDDEMEKHAPKPED